MLPTNIKGCLDRVPIGFTASCKFHSIRTYPLHFLPLPFPTPIVFFQPFNQSYRHLILQGDSKLKTYSFFIPHHQPSHIRRLRLIKFYQILKSFRNWEQYINTFFSILLVCSKIFAIFGPFQSIFHAANINVHYFLGNFFERKPKTIKWQFQAIATTRLKSSSPRPH
jgi:hypothetical protein